MGALFLFYKLGKKENHEIYSGMEANSPMELLKLVKLQEIDRRLMELESYKGNLPEQVENLKNNLSGLNEDLSQSKQGLEAIKKLNRSIEMDLQFLRDKLKKYQNQIYSVKTNKEYDAITLEMENLEKKIAEVELKGVEYLEQEEKLTADVMRLDKQISQFMQLLGEKEFELHQKLSQTAAEQNILQSEREAIAVTVDRRFLSTYERIRKGRNGIALADIKNYTCSACYATIPAQTVVEVRQMNKVINCEVCGRILVIVNNYAEKTVEKSSTVI